VNPDDIVILCGHLNSLPASGPAPGADDIASGSVAVLLAAELLSQWLWRSFLPASSTPTAWT